MNNDTFFISKTGYQCNPELTFDTEDREAYWNPERISRTFLYQFEVYKQASKLYQKNNYSTVLDLGCGPPTKLHHFFAPFNGYCVLADQPNAKKLASEIFPNAKFYAVDLNTPIGCLSDQKFDLIICADVIEHLSRPDHLLSTIMENLNSGGKAIISSPDRDIRRGTDNLRPNNPAHVREWNKRELKEFLEVSGFEVLSQESVPIERLPSWKNWLRRKMGIFRKDPVASGGQMVVCKTRDVY
jgi:SAM-dependent methyltransferase